MRDERTALHIGLSADDPATHPPRPIDPNAVANRELDELMDQPGLRAAVLFADGDEDGTTGAQVLHRQVDVIGAFEADLPHR